MGHRKRPCCICRKWFLPDVRQRGRQKTCSKRCGKEYHRRQCAEWNHRHTEYHKANYLSGKLGEVDKPPPKTDQTLARENRKRRPQTHRTLNLPRDVIREAVGPVHLLVLEYVLGQTQRKNGRIPSQDEVKPDKHLQVGFQEATTQQRPINQMVRG